MEGKTSRYYEFSFHTRTTLVCVYPLFLVFPALWSVSHKSIDPLFSLVPHLLLTLVITLGRSLSFEAACLTVYIVVGPGSCSSVTRRCKWTCNKEIWFMFREKKGTLVHDLDPPPPCLTQPWPPSASKCPDMFYVLVSRGQACLPISPPTPLCCVLRTDPHGYVLSLSASSMALLSFSFPSHPGEQWLTTHHTADALTWRQKRKQ